jgi:hypothetical protein
MALVINNKRTINLNTGKVVAADVTLNAVYTTGGYPVTPALFGLDQIDSIIVGTPAAGGVVGSYDDVGVQKLKFWQTTTGTGHILTQVASSQDISTVLVPVLVFGT